MHRLKDPVEVEINGERVENQSLFHKPTEWFGCTPPDESNELARIKSLMERFLDIREDRALAIVAGILEFRSQHSYGTFFLSQYTRRVSGLCTRLR